MKTTLFALALFAVTTSAHAWGEKGHLIANEAATLTLPNDMPIFFYQAFPELVWLGYDPDRWRRDAGPSLDAVNAPDHFIDYEYVTGLQLPPDRYAFIDLLHASGRLRRHGLTSAEVGFVPWRVAELAEKLTAQFRQWRFSTAGSSERRFLERDIINTAGILGHYVADSANPHHATLNYNGWVLPNPNGYAYDCDTHSRFETYFVSHAVGTEDVVPKVAAPTLRTDYFATALGLIGESNALTERLYQIDRDGGFALIGPVSSAGFNFATDRLAAGASMLRDLWWSAWVNSKRSLRRRQED